LRRTLYGLVLSMPHIASALPTPPPKPTPPSVRPSSDADSLASEPSLTLQLSLFRPDAVPSFAASNFTRFYGLRHGVALDYALGEGGGLHLALFAKRDARRWELNAQPPAAAFGQARLWSLGGAVEVVRLGVDRRRTLTVAPQLLVDLDRLTGAAGELDLTVQYSPWRTSEPQASRSQSVPQLSLKWRF
jgi:hypothetical protein